MPMTISRKQKILIIILLIITAVIILLQILPPPRINRENPWLRAQGETMVIVHGGAKELYPENTVLAFQEISKLKIDAIETDLALTKDNILITHHDLEVDRMSNGSGKVIDLEYSQIRDLNFGVGFPGLNQDYPYKSHPLAYPDTIENLFITYPGFYYVIELKDKGETGKLAADELYRLTKKYGMEHRVLIASFSDEVIDYFREISKGDLLLSTAKGEALRYVIYEKTRLGFFFRPKTHALEVPLSEKAGGIEIRLDNSHFIRQAHRHGMAVHYWTVNDENIMKELIKKGADGIITDRPDLLIPLLIPES
jgi:glycerophosphoryl diester phosphodiesterase